MANISVELISLIERRRPSSANEVDREEEGSETVRRFPKWT